MPSTATLVARDVPFHYDLALGRPTVGGGDPADALDDAVEVSGIVHPDDAGRAGEPDRFDYRRHTDDCGPRAPAGPPRGS